VPQAGDYIKEKSFALITFGLCTQTSVKKHDVIVSCTVYVSMAAGLGFNT